MAGDCKTTCGFPGCQRLGGQIITNIDLLEQQELLDIFGNFTEKSAAEMDAGVNWLANVYRTGRNAWRIIEEARAAEIAELQAGVIAGQGTHPVPASEKRIFLARLVRANLSSLDLVKGGDLLASIIPTEFGNKLTLADKLWAIEIDNDLAGDGDEAEANDELGKLLNKIRDEGRFSKHRTSHPPRSNENQVSTMARVLEWLAGNAVVSVKQAAVFYVEELQAYRDAEPAIIEKNARLMLCAMQRARLVKRAPSDKGKFATFSRAS